MSRELIPNDVLRERFRQLQVREGLRAEEVAVQVGWLRPGRNCPDGQRVERALGLACDDRKRTRRFVTYENAVRLADALRLDPYEVGV